MSGGNSQSRRKLRRASRRTSLENKPIHPLESTPSQRSEKKYDTGLFLSIVGLLLAAAFYLFQSNGIVAIGWITSAVIYAAILAFFMWSFSRWEKPRHWKRLKAIGICVLICVVFI